MSVVAGSCCPNVYFCVGGVIVSQSPGPAPSGFTGGPWATEAEALVGCPVPAVTLMCCTTGPTMPGAVWFNLSNATGFMAGRLPNSTKVTVVAPSPNPGQIAYGSTSVVDSIGDVWNFRVFVYCNPATNPTGWQVLAEVLPGIGYYTGGSTIVSTPVAPWVTAATGGADVTEKRDFTCAASWALSAPEPVAGVTLSHITYGAGHYDWSVSR